jgi:hypothetical protein
VTTRRIPERLDVRQSIQDSMWGRLSACGRFLTGLPKVHKFSDLVATRDWSSRAATVRERML